MTQPNTDLLYRTLDNVLAADVAGTWYQGSWIDVANPDSPGTDENMCGTTACFAGHALLTLGGHILTRRVDCRRGGYIEAYGVQMPDGVFVSASAVEEEARKALRLPRHSADRLFHSDNDLATLKVIVDEIAATR